MKNLCLIFPFSTFFLPLSFYPDIFLNSFLNSFLNFFCQLFSWLFPQPISPLFSLLFSQNFPNFFLTSFPTDHKRKTWRKETSSIKFAWHLLGSVPLGVAMCVCQFVSYKFISNIHWKTPHFKSPFYIYRWKLHYFVNHIILVLTGIF